MTDTAHIGLPDAARRLGVTLRVLRRAIRAGKLTVDGKLTAHSAVSAEWLRQARAIFAAEPALASRAFSQKVPAYARYEGTSAWRKYRARVHAYHAFRAAAEAHAV